MTKILLPETLVQLYSELFAHYGSQDAWWPIFTTQPQFEIILGSLLVQQTRWERVELAIIALHNHFGAEFTPATLSAANVGLLTELIRPVAYYAVKAIRLQQLCAFFAAHPAGSLDAVLRSPLGSLRAELLALPGIGPETADTILLYAAGLPTFIIDAYTRRLFQRLHCLPLDPMHAPYHQLQSLFHETLDITLYVAFPHLNNDLARLYADLHALIVEHGVRHCTARSPRCRASGAGRTYTAAVGRIWHCPPCNGCPLFHRCDWRGAILPKLDVV